MAKITLSSLLAVSFAILLFFGRAQAENLSFRSIGGELIEDFKFTVNSIEADAEDIVTSPLHIRDAAPLLREPKFYFTLLGAGAAFGGAYALDQTIRVRLDQMSNSDADLLQNVSYGAISASTVLLYGYGLYSDDVRARDYAITAGESAGLASLFAIAIKAAFGRLRPRQSSSHTEFFKGGASFVSGDVTPMFALAAGISEYFENKWYIAGPIYSAALLDGFGRMGHDAHWFSDVVGAALLGIATTELLLWLHKKHAEHPDRFRIFPVTAPTMGTGSSLPSGGGIGLGFGW